MKKGKPSVALWAIMGLVGAVWFLAEELGEDPGLEPFRRGIRRAQAKQWEEAEGEFRLAVAARGPDLLSRARHNLGWALLRQALEGEGEPALGKARQAAAHLEAALRLRPGEVGVAWNLELALRRVEELESSQEVVEQAEARALLATLGVTDGGGRGVWKPTGGVWGVHGASRVRGEGPWW